MAATTETATGAASTTDSAGDKGGTTKAAETTTGTAETKTADTTTAAETKTADTTDTKTADAGTKTGSTADATASKAPEKYALTLPAGGRIDASDLTAIETVARAQNWTNDEAQQRVNDHAAAIEAQSAQFLEQTQADPVYGGAHLPETLKHASAALDHFRPKGTPLGDALRGLLDKSGYGNHPAVISLFADLGKQMAEDQPGSAHQTAAGTTTAKADVKSSADVGKVLYGGTA